MSVGKPERATQDRVIALFRDELDYRYPGDWTDRAGNSNVEEALLQDYLHRAGYDDLQIGRAISLLRVEAGKVGSTSNTVLRVLPVFRQGIGK